MAASEALALFVANHTHSLKTLTQVVTMRVVVSCMLSDILPVPSTDDAATAGELCAVVRWVLGTSASRERVRHGSACVWGCMLCMVTNGGIISMAHRSSMVP